MSSRYANSKKERKKTGGALFFREKIIEMCEKSENKAYQCSPISRILTNPYYPSLLCGLTTWCDTPQRSQMPFISASAVPGEIEVTLATSPRIQRSSIERHCWCYDLDPHPGGLAMADQVITIFWIPYRTKKSPKPMGLVGNAGRRTTTETKTDLVCVLVWIIYNGAPILLQMCPFQPVLGISKFFLHSQFFSVLFRYSCGRSGAGTFSKIFVESISDSCAKAGSEF